MGWGKVLMIAMLHTVVHVPDSQVCETCRTVQFRHLYKLSPLNPNCSK